MILITKNKEIHVINGITLDGNRGLEILTTDGRCYTIHHYEDREEAQKVLESIADTVATQGHNAIIIL
jgi:hypothetical protein